MLNVNTNLSSLRVQRNLIAATSGMDKMMERLSTGHRINSARDDAAGSSVSTMMESQISAFDVAEANATMGLSLLETSEGIYDIIGDYLQRIRDLTEQACNGTYGSQSLRAIRTEVQQRMLEINRLCSTIEFNGIQLMDGTSNAYRTGNGLNLQVSNNSGGENVINLEAKLFEKTSCTALFITNNTQNVTGDLSAWYERLSEKEDVTALQARVEQDREYTSNGMTYDYTSSRYKNIKETHYASPGSKESGLPSCITALCDAVYTDDSTARAFLYFIDDALENVSEKAALVGAYMNRLESAIDAIGVQRENIISSNSSIKDNDVSQDASEYIRYQILQQSAATLLSTANQSPSIALNLV